MVVALGEDAMQRRLSTQMLSVLCSADCGYFDSSFFFFLNKFISFWLCWVFVAVRGLLIAVAFLVAEHGL